MTTPTLYQPANAQAGLRNPLIARRLDARVRDALTGTRPLTRGTARVLAACFHSGIDSALCAFAATGRLDSAQAAAELNRTARTAGLDPHFRALADYVTARKEATTTHQEEGADHGSTSAHTR